MTYCQCKPTEREVEEVERGVYYVCNNCDKEILMPDAIDTDLEYEVYKESQMEDEE